jgi:hypothetical protein
MQNENMPIPLRGMDGWCYATGFFILNFGTLDLAVFEFLEAKLVASEYEKLKERPLAERLDRIEKLLESDPEKLRVFQALCQRLDPYRQLRNHIAHGHLLLRAGFPNEKPTLSIALAKSQTAFGGIAEPVDLIKQASEVGNLGDEFRDFFGLYSEPQK